MSAAYLPRVRKKLHKHIVRANGTKFEQLMNVVKGYPDIPCPSISTYLQE